MNALLSCLRNHLWRGPSCTVIMTEVDACRGAPSLPWRPLNKANTARRSLSRTVAFDKHRVIAALAQRPSSRLLMNACIDTHTIHRHGRAGARLGRYSASLSAASLLISGRSVFLLQSAAMRIFGNGGRLRQHTLVLPHNFADRSPMAVVRPRPNRPILIRIIGVPMEQAMSEVRPDGAMFIGGGTSQQQGRSPRCSPPQYLQSHRSGFPWAALSYIRIEQ
jgi:hypothetical protein